MTEKTYIEIIAEKMAADKRYRTFFKEDVGTMPALAKDEDNAAKVNADKKNAAGEKSLKDAGLEVPSEQKAGAGGSTTRGADKVQQDPDNKKAYDAMGVKLGEEAKDVDADNAEKALKHDCATHVVHKEHGEGKCIPGMHTLEENEDGTGYVTHYDVMFDGEEGPYIVEDCPVEDLEVIKEKNHGHMKKKVKVTEALAPGHEHKDDKTYAVDDEADDDHQLSYANHQAKVISHAKKQGYKVNHDDNNHKHKRPDITMHTAMGDHDPHGYTVHKNGNAHKDKVLHAPEHIVEDLEIVAEAYIEEATITVDHDKARHDPKTRHADPYVHGGYRGVSSDKWNAAHKYLMKKKGVSDHHASLIKKHEDAAKSNKTKSSNKKGYEGMSHHDGYTVHSSYDDQGHGGGGVAKYHIHKSN